jgi:hypothetical protein
LVYRTPLWITAPFGGSGARYRAETAITLAMTSADIIMNFMFDLPLCCPPTQIANVRRYRMDKARVWSKQNTRVNIGMETLTQSPQERIKNGSCRAARKGLLTSKFGRPLRMSVPAVEIDPKFRDAAYFAVRRETDGKLAIGTRLAKRKRQACPQLAKAEMHPPKRGSNFDPKPTYAGVFRCDAQRPHRPMMC